MEKSATLSKTFAHPADGARAWNKNLKQEIWNRNEDTMTMQLIRKAMRYGSAALILAGLLGAASLVSQTTTPPPKKPAVAAKPAAKAPTKPATNTGGAKTPTTTPKPGITPKPGHPRPVPVPTPNPKRINTPFDNRPKPRYSHDRVNKDGSVIRTRSNGSRSDFHDARRGMDVHHGLGGGRRVSVDRPGHGRIVSERGRRGYVQRGYPYHGHDFGRRAYFYHGHEYNRYYRGYEYRGMYLNVYAPGFYYGPGFYGWAYNPWAAPIAFGWGWGVGNPWFGFYGGYFQPYPVYPSAAFWLTDYIISQDLQAAYAARQAGENDGAPAAAGGQPVLTPEVKQMIAEEVKSQLALENQEAQQNTQGQDVNPGSSSIERMLTDVSNGHPHVFVAGSNLDVTDASSGAECVVSDGDALKLQDCPCPERPLSESRSSV